MKIQSATLFPLEIPFVDQFTHATKTRSSGDAILLKTALEDGTIGWGETLVRPYLTGEAVEQTVENFTKIYSVLADVDWHLNFDADTPRGKLAPLTSSLDRVLKQIFPSPPLRSLNGLRCLIELALVDALLRQKKMGLGGLLPPVRQEVIYSGVISADDSEKSAKTARQLRQIGIQDYKLKITPHTPVQLVEDIRAIIGEASLRLDANASFDLPEATALFKALEPYNIAAVEEPLLNPTPKTLAKLQAKTVIPVMADESVVTAEDAKELATLNSAKMFNVRVAKCGGIAKCVELAEIAREANIEIQLGVLVGETAILSAVGRTLAASNKAYRFVEGSYGTLLLKEDVSSQSIRFGHGGKAPLIRGQGFGVSIDEAIVRKYTRQQLMRVMGKA